VAGAGPARASAAPALAEAAPATSSRESRRIRASMRVSRPSDPAEREAESTARRVVAMPPPLRLMPVGEKQPLQAALAAAVPVPRPALPAGSAAPPTRGAPSDETSPEIAAAVRSELGGGRPLPAAVAAFMAPRFKADFSAVRIHTGGKAANLATRLGARAFTFGRDIFFGRGEFRPETDEGRELIAHELTHTLQQQAAVQRAAAQDSPMPPYDLAVPELGTIRIEEENPVKATKGGFLRATVPTLKLPFKGKGDWVAKAYGGAAKGGSLIYAATAAGGKVKATTDPVPNYKGAWLARSGFGSLKDMGEALAQAKPPLSSAKAQDLLDAFATEKLGGSLCDIDHIIEKQLQGSNIEENLQILGSTTNRSAGKRTKDLLVNMAELIMAVRPGVSEIRLAFSTVEFETAGPTDEYLEAGLEIERRLRSGLKGKSAGAPVADGVHIGLLAGGKSASVTVAAKGKSEIKSPANLLVTGMRLNHYVRGSGGDKVTGALRPHGLDETDPLTLDAAPAAAKAGARPVVAGEAAPGESRSLKFPEGKHLKLKSHYPFLSPATITSLTEGEDGLRGTGVITPSIAKFLGPIEFAFAPGSLKATKDIPAEKMRTPAKNVFRFTSGSLALELAPRFVPTGSLEFTIGPAAQPIIAGRVEARFADGAFIATGDLWPARKIPGVDKASGKVEYHSAKGWSGKLAAESSAIPHSTTTAQFRFSEENGKLVASGDGGILTRIGTKELSLALDWDGREVAYRGQASISDPFPMVKQVTLDGRYTKGVLSMAGEADIVWNRFKAKMKVGYVRKDAEENGRFSGEATVRYDTEKAGVKLNLKYDDAGKLTGSGTAAYQVTKDVRPEIGIELSKDGRVKATGEAKLADLSFGKAWPGPPNDKRTIIKGGMKFRFPTPLVVVNGFGEVTGSLGVRFGVGPVMMRGVVFRGEFYPLEADPKIKARLKGALVVPGFGELYGTVGAFLGVEVLGGAVGLKGGIQAQPSLRVAGEAGLAVDVAYASGAFAFSAEAYAKGRMTANLKINLSAQVSAGYDYWTHEWLWNVASMTRNLGPELKLSLGRIAYSPQGGMTWPSLSQVKLEPASLDAMTLVQGLLADAKAKEGEKEPRKR
jgi:hypothetical protein